MVPSPLLQLPNTFRVFYGAFAGLYPLQAQAIEPVLAHRDLIIQSATGSGKTEAVLAPCLERIISSGLVEAALYIVPTRALAFDIRRRFASVLRERLGINFAIRTGDLKRSGGGCPHLMLTTPESLDVMLGSANVDLRGFLQRVRTVIIDEVHPLIHQYRGRQLTYLLYRLERRIGKPLQKIALSATIADPQMVGRFLNVRPDFVLLTEGVSRRILPRLLQLKNDDNELVNLLGDLYREWKYRKILIFANSRGRCDKIFAVLNQKGPFKGMAELHYSNLKAKERQGVEKRFRRRPRSVCIATSTLELGIDVGDVDAVVLFEPPDSVSAFLQRIGRSNRRQQTIHFWGICRGERAAEQLLRFLALLHLAGEGRVEAPLPDDFPSVLSQQLVSCLYEKKQLSLKAVQELFAASPAGVDGADIKDIFNSLRRKKWLKKTAVANLYQGGWPFWNALVEHRLWSNFPETEQEYSLEIAGETVADIPHSMVKQFDPGDHVLLAGRRLRIVAIDEGENKRVVAEPSPQSDGKELSWLGMGSHVSYDVAQAMRAVLKSARAADNEAAPGLFSRTRTLIQQELEKDKKAVTLANGIEVLRAANGAYHYRTFIGAVGNLVLAWSIRETYGGQCENLEVTADEMGVFCSHPVDFAKLFLPLTEAEFNVWIDRHFKVLRAMFPLNSFCATLPKEMLLRELASFIRDPRLVDFFKRCRHESSKIVKGDPKNLELWPQSAKEEKTLSAMPAKGEPLLAWEKNRRAGSTIPAVDPNRGYHSRALTGSLIGNYFRHQQCQRWFCFQFLLSEDQSRGRQTRVDNDMMARRQALRWAQGREFKEKILSHLRTRGDCSGGDPTGKIFSIIAEKDENGRVRSLKDRFAETVCQLESLAGQNLAADTYLHQPVLLVAGILSPAATFFNHQENTKIFLPGVGIPELIRMVAGEENLLQVGNIISGRRPSYYQKWQLAFYAFLLRELLHNEPQLSRFKVADRAFLLMPSPFADQPQWHTFALRPYLATMKTLLVNFQALLCAAPIQACWQLQKHCVGCPYFEFCYGQALKEEEVQFIPQLGRGLLQKIRSRGWKNFKHDDDFDTSFGPGQRDYLQGSMHALHQHQVVMVKKRTAGFPANISTSFFVRLLGDPQTNTGRYLGLALASRARGGDPEIMTWTAFSTEERRRVWEEFSHRLLSLWQAAVQDGRGPHIFLFGATTRQVMLDWALMMADRRMWALLRPGIEAYCTDLQQLLFHHFRLPIPGNVTLFALNRVLGLMDEAVVGVPESLFHGDRLPEMTTDGDGNDAESDRERVKDFLVADCRLIMKLEHWIAENLESEWHREDWRIIHPDGLDWMAACRQFIEAERVQREREIRSLGELSLAERVERFRALGPLRFTGTTLDDEGRFLYLFSQVDCQAGRAKFRPGDFLKLVPAGVRDLQSGIPVVMAGYDARDGQVALSCRLGGNRALAKATSSSLGSSLSFSLEEDGQDYHSSRLLEAVQRGFSAGGRQPIMRLFAGTLNDEQQSGQQQWLSGWLLSEGAAARLNPSQQQALALPFQYALSLISGPPGSGKTNLLGWVLIALIRHAQANGRHLRIAVTAVTHQAIDQVLNKVVNLVNTHELADFPARCIKWGRWEGAEFAVENRKMQVEPIAGTEDVERLWSSPYLIVGATGYGLDAMLKKQNNSGAGSSSRLFDWVIFDEASQMLTPQALLSLVHGKGNFLFLGDVCQLPPVIRSSIFNEEMVPGNDAGKPGSIAAETRCSLLDILLRRYPHRCRQLEVTYRMNAEICQFPSRMWYEGRLRPAVENARSRLSLTARLGNDLFDMIIDPEKPVVLLGVKHQGCGQESALEAGVLSRLAGRLLLNYGIKKEQMAIISPHRAQNNAIAASLRELLGNGNNLPLIDTVERMQGAERDVILFGFTCSDPDLVLSEFLNNPQRFNVAITRARQKLIVLGSKIFFEAVANSEKQLQANACFKDFFAHCRKNNCYFEVENQ